MKSRLIVGCAIVLLGTAICVDVAIAQQRIIRHKGGTKIADLLRANDTDVVIDDAGSPPSVASPPAGVSWLEWRTQLADFVVVARLQHEQSFLTPDGTEVRSNLTFRVSDVLKDSSRRSFSAGGTFEWETFGGTVTVGKTRVRAATGWSRDFKQGTDYLVFGKISPEGDPLGAGRLVMGPTSMFEVTKAGLSSLVFDHSEESLTDEPLSKVTTAVRAVKRPAR